MSKIELKARELLAAEWEKLGGCGQHVAEGIRRGAGLPLDIPALRVIESALAPQWQPIATAPKDLSTFLAGEFYFAGGECTYKEFSTAYRHQDGQVHCYDENVSPTHWQPLPAPPEVEG